MFVHKRRDNPELVDLEDFQIRLFQNDDRTYWFQIHDLGMRDLAYEDHGSYSKAKAISEAKRVIKKELYAKNPRNPTAEAHEKAGRDYMMKARSYWERYAKHGRPKDLVDAYEYLNIAHEELKYADDRDSLKEVKEGKKAAKAELLSLLKPKKRGKKVKSRRKR